MSGLWGRCRSLDLRWMDTHEHYLAIVASRDKSRTAIDEADTVFPVVSSKLIALTSGRASLADVRSGLEEWGATDESLF